ncbi:MAG: dipeptidyl peptidase 3 [Prevotella sp.]|nr:dipeptidyl peptidase 3 [Prevotella sp.]
MTCFCYCDERFADLQLLRYRLEGFEQLELRQKRLVFFLSQATLFGRDITFDQFGKYNLRIRKMLEAVYTDMRVDHDSEDFRAMAVYLKRLWFSSGIHHHYGCEKFVPAFSCSFLRDALHIVDPARLPLNDGQTVDGLCDELFPVIFDPQVLPKRVNMADGEDLLLTSACNFYQGVSQQEAEAFYAHKKQECLSTQQPALNVDNQQQQPSWGLNTTLIKKEDGQLEEQAWTTEGRYANALRHIVYWLEKARDVAENKSQEKVIQLLIDYYQTGDLRIFDQYSIQWLQTLEGKVDFINGFIEVYGDPLGLKGSWEGLVEYVDEVATRRTETISQQAQWFEDHSPVDPRFRKPKVTGVSARVICAAMLGGDEYPATAIGINLPNADWIRARYGSKSITISNITDAYNKASHGNGFREEFVIDAETFSLIERYGDICDNLHTDLHECLGHGSGQLMPGVDADALKAYGSTIEEARADLFALYYLADQKLVELGLLPDATAYQAAYYTYMMNGLLTQLVRIEPGHQIEEAHMRNRALIARWCLDKGHCMQLLSRDGKTYLCISSYPELRQLVAQLLAEIQRIKSEGDYEAARVLVEKYAVDVDPLLHSEVLARYRQLNLAPYKGFINPWLLPVYDENGDISDVQVNYSESYEHQMLRYSAEYGTLI